MWIEERVMWNEERARWNEEKTELKKRLGVKGCEIKRLKEKVKKVKRDNKWMENELKRYQDQRYY